MAIEKMMKPLTIEAKSSCESIILHDAQLSLIGRFSDICREQRMTPPKKMIEKCQWHKGLVFLVVNDALSVPPKCVSCGGVANKL